MTHIPGHFQAIRPPVNRLGPTQLNLNDPRISALTDPSFGQQRPFNVPTQGGLGGQPTGGLLGLFGGPGRRQAPAPIDPLFAGATGPGGGAGLASSAQFANGQFIGGPSQLSPEDIARINAGNVGGIPANPQQQAARFDATGRAINDPGMVQTQPGISLALPAGQVPAGPVQPPTGQVQTQPFGQPVPLNQPQVPPTGLIGSEAALQAGLQGGLGALAQGGQGALNLLGGAAGEARGFLGGARQDILGGFGQGQQAIGQAIGQGVQGLQGFQQPGQGAFDLLSAQLGVGGPQAQQQALQNFQFGPGVDFQVEQGRRLLGSGAAAQGGGTRGGDFTRDLTRFSQGLAQQDLARQQGLLSNLGGQGLQAAGQIGQLRGQQAGLQGSLFGQQAGQLGNLGQFGAGQAFNFGQAGSGLLQNLGINQANLLSGAGRDVSAGRLGTGQRIATALGTGAGDVSRLQETGGAGLSDILGGAGINAATLQTQFGNLSAADQQQLAAILANISTGQGSQLANIQNQPFTAPNTLGQLGQIASGVGGVLAAFPNQPQQPQIPPLATINTGSQFAGFA